MMRFQVKPGLTLGCSAAVRLAERSEARRTVGSNGLLGGVLG
jgi:hypothetical protein